MTSPKLSLFPFNVFFWTFNATLLLVIYIGFLPFLGFSVFVDALDGKVPVNFIVPFIGLVGVPTSCTVAGLIPVEKRSLSLFQLFYGVEAPLLVLCLMRFFWLRDLTPVNTLIMVTGVLGTIAYAHWLFMQRQEDRPQTHWGHLAGHVLMLLLSLYLSLIAAFYVPPTLYFLGQAFLPMLVYATILLPLFVLLLGLGSLPFGMTLVYWRSCRHSLQAITRRYGQRWGYGLTIGILTLWLGSFVVLQQQPQQQAFALLKEPPTTDQARQALVQRSETIRQGLLNAYLAAYRYPYVEDTSIRSAYQYPLGFSEATAQAIQEAYSFVTAPFTYQGKQADRDKAAALYAEFFDAPILRAEKAAIKKAIQSTFQRDQAKAGLLDIGEQRVWLAEQQVTVTPQGDWADVELHEVYENRTLDQQEILYYFSLPESAAITGLWLGETPDRQQAYPFTIASRGAAQQVYNQEVTIRVDPALLEQVGPRNYRLRAFPVPSIGQGRLHLWLTYKVLQQEASWPMPQLSEQRNVYWTGRTQRLVNGKPASHRDWLPKAIPAQTASPTAHQMALPWGAQVLALPFSSTDYQLPHGQRFAIILDGSRSMDSHRQELDQTFRWLRAQVLNQNRADLYLTTAAPAKARRIDDLKALDLQTIAFYGTLQPREMLQQFLQQQGETRYDAILLITDPGSYELTADSPTALAMPAPLWMVHLGGLPAAYDDSTLQAIQASGGQVTTQVQEVMQRLGTTPTQGAGSTFLNLVDGYAWYAANRSDVKASIEAGFNPLAARQWVTHLTQYIKPTELQQLDTIHQLTQNYGIVTPYSSMIVLVNDRQRQNLAAAEKSNDRFQREVEDQQLPQPNANLSAVPEPSEWLLLLAGAIGLGLLVRWSRSGNGSTDWIEDHQ